MELKMTPVQAVTMSSQPCDNSDGRLLGMELRGLLVVNENFQRSAT